MNKSNTPKRIKDSWQTPLELFQTLDKEFNFTLDVASSDSNHLVPKYYTIDDNALDRDWGKVNWCNPPYSKIGPWVKKAIEEWEKGNATIMLIPSDTSVKWFKEAWESCNEVRFISGRIAFINADTGVAEAGNNKGSVLFIWHGSKLLKPLVKLINREKYIKKVLTK